MVKGTTTKGPSVAKLLVQNSKLGKASRVVVPEDESTY
jgi:hypothetical protein